MSKKEKLILGVPAEEAKMFWKIWGYLSIAIVVGYGIFRLFTWFEYL